MATDRHARRSPKREDDGSALKPSINIIGAGRMGTALGIALAARGYKIEAVVARRKANANRAAKLIDPSVLALRSSQLHKIPTTDLILITTPDDVIEFVAAQLAANPNRIDAKERKVRGTLPKKTIALHASGALSSEALARLPQSDFATGSMHPLVSVNDPLQGAESLRSAFFCIEGDAMAQRAARSLVSDLGGESFSIKAKDKALYHAAAVMASGHVTALFDISIQMLTECGLSAGRARAALGPLLKSTLDNLYTSDPARALTGTFARADKWTVKRHLAVLRAPRFEQARRAYVLLGLRSLALSRKAGTRLALVEEIATLLKEADRTDGSGSV